MDQDIDRRGDVRVTVIELVKLAIEPLSSQLPTLVSRIESLEHSVREGFSGAVSRDEVERRIGELTTRIEQSDKKRVEGLRWTITTILAAALVITSAVSIFAAIHR